MTTITCSVSANIDEKECTLCVELAKDALARHLIRIQPQLPMWGEQKKKDCWLGFVWVALMKLAVVVNEQQILLTLLMHFWR